MAEKGDILKAASLGLQAHEELHYIVNKAYGGDDAKQDIVLECRSIMDQLRQLKSKIEGTHLQLLQPTFDPALWSQLRSLVLSHTPSSLTEQDKARLADLLTNLLQEHVKMVLYCCLMTCPWFAGAQTQLDKQAKGNRLLVVYASSVEQFFSLASQHERKQANIIEQDFLYAVEVHSFCSGLLSGNVRSVEAFNASAESLIVCSPDWLKLGALLNPKCLLGKKFVDRCIGQAVMALGKRKQRKEAAPEWTLNSNVPLEIFCNSFRLLSHLQNIVEDRPLCCWTSADFESASERDAMRLLKEAFKGVVERQELFEHVLAWRQQLSEKGVLAGWAGTASQCAGGGSEEPWTAELGQWLADVSLCGTPLPALPPLLSDSRQRLSELFASLKLSGFEPEQVLVVCEAGSKLYNLSLPTSDTDYIIIFQHPTYAILSSLNPLKEMQDSRGLQSLEEAGAYEARMFCEMLIKGSVNIFEVLFADTLFYSSKAWSELISNRHLFVSEKVILQYVGYIKTHMQRIGSAKFSGLARERKLFYNVFHKLLSLESLVEHGVPVVRCTGADREFIMRIRTGPLEGDLTAHSLYSLAEDRLARARAKLRARTYRNRELGDYKYLQRWLNVSVRGFTTE